MGKENSWSHNSAIQHSVAGVRSVLSPAQGAVGEGDKDLGEEEEWSETVIFSNAKELRSTSMMPPSRESQTQLEELVRDFHYTKGFRDLELRPEERL